MIFACFALVSVSSGGMAAASVSDLLDAMQQVESGSRTAVWSSVIGDAGRSLGPLQIQRSYWKDAGLPGRYDQVQGREYARRVAIAYWRRYSPGALARGDLQRLARIHNGGPAGWRYPATWSYWMKVKRHLR